MAIKTQTEAVREFEKHMTSRNWEGAVQAGEELVDRLSAEGVELDPRTHYALHNNLGIAYWLSGKEDAVHDPDSGRVVDYHSIAHLRRAVEIAEKNGLRDLAAKTEELLGQHIGQYILVAELVR